VFTDGLMPWPKHFFPKTFGRLLQLISQPVAGRQKVDGCALDDRAALAGILLVLKTGIPCRVNSAAAVA
jgi:hypothetical protein